MKCNEDGDGGEYECRKSTVDEYECNLGVYKCDRTVDERESKKYISVISAEPTKQLIISWDLSWNFGNEYASNGRLKLPLSCSFGVVFVEMLRREITIVYFFVPQRCPERAGKTVEREASAMLEGMEAQRMKIFFWSDLTES